MVEKITGKEHAAKETWLQIRVSVQAKEQLTAWSQKADVSVSRLVRGLIDEAISSGRAERGEIPVGGR